MASNNIDLIEIYTDGSCNTRFRVGTWVAILLIGLEKKILTGWELETTHQRMELTAVIKGIDYVMSRYANIKSITIFPDSQYVVDLPARKGKISTLGFTNKKGNDLRNAELVKEFFKLTELMKIDFIKIKAHQKKNASANYNIEADRLSRKLLREVVRENFE